MSRASEEQDTDSMAFDDPAFPRADRLEEMERQQLAQDIGAQMGLSFRAPVFGQDTLMGRARDYASASAQKNSVEFNKLTIGNSDDAISSAVKKQIGVGTSYSFNVSGQLGMIGPIIGLGPYGGVSISVGYTAAGDSFLQLQGSIGAGMGTFYSVGTSNSILGGGALTEGWSGEWRAELNAGLGPESITATLNRDLDWTANWSQLLSPSLAKGQTEGLALAGVYGATYTVSNPDLRAKKIWDEFSVSAGRDLNRVEIRIYNLLMTNH